MEFGYLRKDFALDLDQYRLRKEINLKDLLRMLQLSRCSDICDGVYGLAGLAKDGQELRIDSSKSVFEIFADVLFFQRTAESASLMAFAHFLQRVLEFHPWNNIPDDESLSEECVRTVDRKQGEIHILQLYVNAQTVYLLIDGEVIFHCVLH